MTFQVESESLRNCIEKYFHQFFTEIESVKRIQQQTDGLVLKAQEFEPFVPPPTSKQEISKNLDKMETDSNDHLYHAPVSSIWHDVNEQIANLDSENDSAEWDNNLEQEESLDGVFADIADGQFKPKQQRRLVSYSESQELVPYGPFLSVAVILILCVLLRAPFRKM